MANGERRVQALKRQMEALKLRLSGESYDSIASKLGYSARGPAYAAVMRALKTTLQEPADEVRKLEVERLDQLLLGMWPYATGDNPNPDAVDRALKIMERRAKLLGLDAPTQSKVDLVGPNIDAAIERELAKLAVGGQAAPADDGSLS